MPAKMACQPKPPRMRLPSVGDTAGPAASMRPIRFIMRAERCPLN
jgi:hypothetical protein